MHTNETYQSDPRLSGALSSKLMHNWPTLHWEWTFWTIFEYFEVYGSARVVGKHHLRHQKFFMRYHRRRLIYRTLNSNEDVSNIMGASSTFLETHSNISNLFLAGYQHVQCDP